MKNCQYCSKSYKNIKYHERYCNSNQDRFEFKRPNANTSEAWKQSMLDRTPINGYMKASSIGSTYSLSPEAKRRISISASGRKHSEETKQKISKRRKEFIKNNPDKAPYVMNHYTKGPSYAEQYFLDVFKNTDFVYHYKFHTYELDFADVENKINIEIDGEQHYCDDRIVRHDIKRNAFLEERGWTVIRIRWSTFCKLNDDDRRRYINDILYGPLAQ